MLRVDKFIFSFLPYSILWETHGRNDRNNYATLQEPKFKEISPLFCKGTVEKRWDKTMLLFSLSSPLLGQNVSPITEVYDRKKSLKPQVSGQRIKTELRKSKDT